MNPADFATTKSLRDHLERAVTGKLSVGRGRRAATVYLMNGALMGAESPSDASRLLRRLTVERALSEERASELLIAAQDGESIYGPLFEEAAGPVLERVLSERFRDALADWLAADEEPEFTSMAAVFIDNLQMGVDAEAVIAEALDAIEVGGDVPDEGVLSSGTGMPRGKGELAVRALLRQPTAVDELIEVLPMEPWAARAVIGGMLTRGALTIDTMGEVELAAPPPSPQDETEMLETEMVEPTEMLETEMVEPETEMLETEMLEPETEQFEPLVDRSGFDGGGVEFDSELMGAFEGEDDPSEEISPLLTADVEPLDAATSGAFEYPEVADDLLGAFEEDSEQPAPPLDDGFSGAFEEETEQPVVEDDELFGAFEDDDEGPVSPVGFESGELDDEEVISAFNDASAYRGGSKDAGRFVTESHNLDKVSLDGDVDADLEFEADEVPAQTFGAPRLSEDDAEKKIEVANSVLEVIAQEYDRAQGPGAGRAAVQLLVDGSPLAFAPLFKDVTANGRGGISHFEVLRNLYSRPPTEHRRLLQDGIKNLLDRGMSIAADELPDEGIDAVLESAAGLRQRLGL